MSKCSIKSWRIYGGTAAGSCGFTVHTIFQITGHLFQNTDISEEEKDNVLKVFGIDFDEKVVRVARTLNLIAGDGNTNVLHLNNLDYERWNESIQNRDWLEVYGAGLKRLEALQKDRSSYKEFNFDIPLWQIRHFAGISRNPV